MFHYLLFLLNSIGIYAYSKAGVLPILDMPLYLGTGIGVILFSYAISYLFEKVKTAANWSLLLALLFGVSVPYLTILVKLNPEY